MCEVETEAGIAAVLNVISLSSNLGCICMIKLLDPPNDFFFAEVQDEEGNGGMIREAKEFLSFTLLCSSTLLNNHFAFSMRHCMTCVF